MVATAGSTGMVAARPETDKQNETTKQTTRAQADDPRLASASAKEENLEDFIQQHKMLVAARANAHCTRASPSKGGHSRVASKGNGPAGSKEGGDLRPDRTFDIVVLGGPCALCVQKSRGDARVCVGSRRGRMYASSNDDHGSTKRGGASS